MNEFHLLFQITNNKLIRRNIHKINIYHASKNISKELEIFKINKYKAFSTKSLKTYLNILFPIKLKKIISLLLKCFKNTSKSKNLLRTLSHSIRKWLKASKCLSRKSSVYTGSLAL